MPKLPRLTAIEAEKILFLNDFEFIRSKGSHRIYKKEKIRFVLPFHSGKILHPKIICELFDILEK